MVTKEEYLLDTAARLLVALLRTCEYYPDTCGRRSATLQAVTMAEDLWYLASREGQATRQVDVT